MKKIILSLMLMLAAGAAFAQTVTVDVKDSISTNTTWDASKFYLLKGYVYVTSGTTLTIPAGTVIKGDKTTKGTLIIERGARIIAQGKVDTPIVFTSNEAPGNRSWGDWGGLIICGNAPTNWANGFAQVEGGPRSLYGGTDANDNSGILSYVRIEFGGIAFSPNNEVNGLTLAGVGKGTQLDHIQVSFSGDDAVEWFGGNVNAKYLVTYRTWDDDFDNDAGNTSMNQFCVSLRDPSIADVSGSKAIESDSYLAGTATGLNGDTSKITKAVFSNCTFVGPLVNPTSTAGVDPQYVAGIHLRRGSGTSVLNSVILGFQCGLLIDESSSAFGSTAANIGTNLLQFKNNVFGGTQSNATPSPKDIVYVVNGARNITPTTAQADSTVNIPPANMPPFSPYSGPWNWLKAPVNNNFIYATAQNVAITAPFVLATPNFIPTSASPIVYNSRALPSYIPNGTFPGNVYPFNPTKPINTDTSNLFVNYNAPTIVPYFSNNKANDAFFTQTNYVGAFGRTGTNDNWMNGWTNFDPVNTVYVAGNPGVGVKDINNNVTTAIVFPNPASSTAFVSANLAKAADVTITIVDISGRIVKEVFNGKATAGSLNVGLDIAELKAGIYFVNIATAEGRKSVRLSVIK